MALRTLCVPMNGRVLARVAATPPRNLLALSPRHLYTPLSPSPSPSQSQLQSRSGRGSRTFCSTRISMTATKIDGTAIAKSIRERLGAQIKKRQEVNARYRPNLKIVQGEWLRCH